MRIARLLLLALSAAAPLGAQAVPSTRVGVVPSHDAFVVGGDWLQVQSLDRTGGAFPSTSFDVGMRFGSWSAEAGWLRIARDLSTVQGGTLSFGRIVSAGPVLFIPALKVLGGQAYVSVDTSGYEFTDSTGAPGHQPRYTYSEGFTFGGGVGVTMEVPVYRWIRARVVASQWLFGGTPVADERTRTVLGAGLTVRVGR